MGILILKGENSTTYYIGSDGEMHTKIRGYFINKNAIENLIHYITRTRLNELRSNELICWGAHGASCSDVNLLITQFKYVQDKSRESTCRKMYHLVYSPDDYEQYFIRGNRELIAKIAMAQSNLLFSLGHQVAFAVHNDKKNGLHIHYAVNSVNYMTGKMFRYSYELNYNLNDVMNKLSLDMIMKFWGYINPIVQKPE